MPISSRESWRQFQSPNKPPDLAGSPARTASSGAFHPGGMPIYLGGFTLRIEPRFFIFALLIPLLYTIAAFVGNDWGYMMPCTLLSALIIGAVLPLLQVASISCSCRVPSRKAAVASKAIILKAWRLPFLGLLTSLMPSGYLHAELHLVRKSWKGAAKMPAVVPLPVVLEALSSGLEICLQVPSLGRGLYEAESLEVATCFPFAIIWWSRRIKLSSPQGEACLTVLPDLKEVSGNFHSQLTATTISAGKTVRNWMLQYRSTSLKGLREFTERDSLNQIHWPCSARAGKLLVREFEVESLPDFDVAVDLEQKWSSSQFDLACSAAYALIHYGHRLGFTPILRLKPSLDWPPAVELMSDMPAGLAGEELAAEILARLLPVPEELANEYKNFAARRELSAIDINADITISPRAVISILPAEEKGSIALMELSKVPGGVEESSSMQVEKSLARIGSLVELSRL